MELVNGSANLNLTFRTLGYFFGHVSTKISEMVEVEVCVAQRAVAVTVYGFFGSAYVGFAGFKGRKIFRRHTCHSDTRDIF